MEYLIYMATYEYKVELSRKGECRIYTVFTRDTYLPAGEWTPHKQLLLYKNYAIVKHKNYESMLTRAQAAEELIEWWARYR